MHGGGPLLLKIHSVAPSHAQVARSTVHVTHGLGPPLLQNHSVVPSHAQVAHSTVHSTHSWGPLLLPLQMIQRRLAWSLPKDDTQSSRKFHLSGPRRVGQAEWTKMSGHPTDRRQIESNHMHGTGPCAWNRTQWMEPNPTHQTEPYAWNRPSCMEPPLCMESNSVDGTEPCACQTVPRHKLRT